MKRKKRKKYRTEKIEKKTDLYLFEFYYFFFL